MLKHTTNKITDIIPSKYKLEKIIRENSNSNVYLVSYGKIKYVAKIVKIVKDQEKYSLKYPNWREIEFSNTMNKINDNFFITFDEHKIIKKNNNIYDFKTYKYIKKTLANEINNYDYNKMYWLIIQIIYIIFLMNKNGYVHSDFHIHNILVDKTDKKKINILGKDFLTGGEIIKLIDYETVLHNKYPFGICRFELNEEMTYKKGLQNEINRLISYTLEFNVWDEIIKYDIDFIQKHKQFKSLKYYKHLRHLSSDKYKLFFFFELLYPLEFQKFILGKNFKKFIPPILRIPIEDIIFISKHKNFKKLLNYFFKQKTKLN